MTSAAHLGPGAPPRPSWGAGRPATVLVGLGVLGVLTGLLPPYTTARPGFLLAAAVLMPVVVGLYTQSIRSDVRTWVDPAAPWLTFVLIAVLREGAGGSLSGLTVLVAVPIAWLALYGTRRDLLVGAVLTTATTMLPLGLVGPPAYPGSGWRPAVFWVGAALFLAPLLQGNLQARGRAQAADEQWRRELAATLDGLLHGAGMVGVLTVDPDGLVLTAGAGVEDQWGLPPASVEGRRLVDLLGRPEEIEQAAAELRVDPGFEVFAKLARLHDDQRVWTCRRPDGETRELRVGVTELRDEPDGVLGYLVICSDETEVRAVRHALEEAEERWRILLEHLPGTSVVLVEQGVGITVVTGAGQLGPRGRDSAGRWLQQLAAEGRVPLEQMLEACFAGQTPAHQDVRTDAGDHELQVIPLPSRGRPLALVVVRDVTRERRRSRAITAAKERAERLFAHAPQGIALLSLDGVIGSANPALGRLLGRTDLEGTRLASLSYDERDTTVQRHLDNLLAGSGHQPTTQWTVRHPGGAEVHVVLESTVLPGQEGESDQVLTNVVDVSERFRYEQQLAHLANHDPLTGLANRRHFDRELERHVESARRYGASGALLLLDLDRFKQVNDTLGHAVGDELLVLVADVLRARLRSGDLVARLGGDEFAVLLTHADRKATESVAGSVVEEVHVRLATYDDVRGTVTVSVGCAVVDADVTDGSDLLSRADSAMYAAKAAGRNQYVVGD